jgi:rod shape-determining protein MreD
VSPLDAAKAAVLLLLVAPFQVSVLSSLEVAEGHPDAILVLLVAIALLRGPIFGSLAGFWAGLAVDVATLAEPLGLSSLLLTLTGYWSGRLGEVTSRSSAHVPLLAVALATLGYGLGSLVVRFMLGTAVPASEFFVAVLVPTLALNVLLAYPLYALVRRLFRPPVRSGREVSALD